MSDCTLEKLLSKASELLGREAKVVPCAKGFIVEYFNFNTPPPPPAPTEVEAVENFIEWFSARKEEDDANND